MNWKEIEKIIKNDGGKFVIVENGEPSLVIMSFNDYKNRNTRMSNVSGYKDGESDVFYNRQGSNSKDNISESSDDLTIDDLPL